MLGIENPNSQTYEIRNKTLLSVFFHTLPYIRKFNFKITIRKNRYRFFSRTVKLKLVVLFVSDRNSLFIVRGNICWFLSFNEIICSSISASTRNEYINLGFIVQGYSSGARYPTCAVYPYKSPRTEYIKMVANGAVYMPAVTDIRNNAESKKVIKNID